MLSAAFTGSIIAEYEEAFAAVPLLVSFIPMIMGTGGNCGSQSSTLIIRGLATDEIKLKDIFRMCVTKGIKGDDLGTIKTEIRKFNLEANKYVSNFLDL